jgi:hypothetical protein
MRVLAGLLVVLVAMVVCVSAQADKFQADIHKEGRYWVLDGVGKNPDVVKLLKQAAGLRAQLERIRSELLGRQYDYARLAKLESALKALEDRINDLASRAQDGASAGEQKAVRDGLAKSTREIARLGRELVALAKRVAADERRLSILESRHVSLDLSAFGGGAMLYSHTAGASVSLYLPLGTGRWGAKLTGGLGISPSNNLGMLTSVSVSARLGLFSIGPAAIYMADLGNTLTNSGKFVAGGGFEASLHITKWMYISALPFAGVGVGISNDWVGPTYVKAPCGKVLVSEGYWVDGNRKPSFAAGAIGSVGFRLF